MAELAQADYIGPNERHKSRTQNEWPSHVSAIRLNAKKTLSAFTRVEWGVQAAAQTGVQAAETGDNQQNRCLINRSKGLLKIGQAK